MYRLCQVVYSGFCGLHSLALKGAHLRIIGNQDLDMNESLWRYFKTERFLELINTRRLYFASAREFLDRFEGAVAVLPAGFPVDPRYVELEHQERAFEQLRRLTKISCWHRASYENDAMWQLYAGANKGVAIRTKPSLISAAAKPFRIQPEYGYEELWAGNVNYVDLLTERLRVNMLDRFWYKHMAFSWENEFRLAVSIRTAEEFGVDVQAGVYVEFDIPTLVDEIYLGPKLSPDEVYSIRSAVQSCGLEGKLKITSMLGTPRYT